MPKTFSSSTMVLSEETRERVEKLKGLGFIQVHWFEFVENIISNIKVLRDMMANTEGEYFVEDDKNINFEKIYSETNKSHTGVRFPCNFCVFKATTKGSLKTHIQSVQERIKYSCNQCDHQATRQGDLKTHIQSVHEKIKYSCNQCDHQATTQGNLKKHIQSIHVKIKYSCNQ